MQRIMLHVIITKLINVVWKSELLKLINIFPNVTHFQTLKLHYNVTGRKQIMLQPSALRQQKIKYLQQRKTLQHIDVCKHKRIRNESRY